jgi:hypothetical protein
VILLDTDHVNVFKYPDHPRHEITGAALGVEPRGSWPPAGSAAKLRRVPSRANVLGNSSPFLPAKDAQYRSIGFIDEDEGGALHDGRAGAHEGDLDIFDLALPRTA